jgi:hypothetical protein
MPGSARLNGQANPTGSPTLAWFEWARRSLTGTPLSSSMKSRFTSRPVGCPRLFSGSTCFLVGYSLILCLPFSPHKNDQKALERNYGVNRGVFPHMMYFRKAELGAAGCGLSQSK